MDSKKVSLSRPALTAGSSLIVMTILSLMIFPSLQAMPYSIAGIILIIFLDIVVALALYFLLRAVNRNLSVIMSAFRIIYAMIFAIALYNISNLTTFYFIWDIGLMFFGIHLFFLGLLVYRSKYIPKLLGILIVIASLGYIIDTVVKFLGYTFAIGMFTFFGEVLFALWLVIKAKQISTNEALS